MTDIWDARRKQLERALIDAALGLTQHTGADALVVPVPNTSPPVYIAVGEPGQISSLLESKTR